MPPNEVDQIDYMAEEGDMSDFADDVDGEENGGGDQNHDDYEMVSLVLFFFCYVVLNSIRFLCNMFYMLRFTF